MAAEAPAAADAALALIAVDPAGLGGVCLRAPAGPARERWLARLRAALPGGAPWRRVPLGVTEDRLLGGLDLPATLAAGRPIVAPGLLADAHGGILVCPSAERLTPAVAGHVSAALDRGIVEAQRDGAALVSPASFGVVALDERGDDEPGPPAALLERLAVHVDLSSDGGGVDPSAEEIVEARARMPAVTADGVADVVVGCAQALGVTSVRALTLALRVARAAAALAGRDAIGEDDLGLAVRLVLLPRATRLPAPPEEDREAPPPSEPPPDSPAAETADADRPLADRILDAQLAALPPGALAMLLSRGRHGRAGGRGGGEARSTRHGRRIGSRRGDPRRARLDLLATVRAAAPWQRLRGGTRERLAIRAGDFQIQRRVQRIGTTVIFLVDASGSAALHRLGEAKGAVELLLGESYVRRDRVALVSFRGQRAELVLPPTRSLARARRTLAGLPGGGGTPLAGALDLARALATDVRRGGGNPLIVLLSDARANVARDGSGGRPKAEGDALAAARGLEADRVPSLVIDTSPRPNPFAARLAAAMSGQYLPLPAADSRAVSGAVRAVGLGGR
jgi:magnesium chelatase subunit D